MKVYISLPITGKDPEQVKALAEEIANVLRENGHEPINPLSSDGDGMTYGQYMGKDITMIIDQADAIIMAQGYMRSRGCRLEYQCALIYRKKIAFYPDLRFKV